MPETAHHMNGYANGHSPPELHQNTNFLFTSESVGEGHPGEYYFILPENFLQWYDEIGTGMNTHAEL